MLGGGTCTYYIEYFSENSTFGDASLTQKITIAAMTKSRKQRRLESRAKKETAKYTRIILITTLVLLILVYLIYSGM